MSSSASSLIAIVSFLTLLFDGLDVAVGVVAAMFGIRVSSLALGLSEGEARVERRGGTEGDGGTMGADEEEDRADDDDGTDGDVTSSVLCVLRLLRVDISCA